MPTTQKQMAGQLALALRIGWVVPQEASDWVDAQIAATNDPDSRLIDAAFLPLDARWDMAPVLGDFGDAIDPEVARAFLVGHLRGTFERGELAGREVAKALYEAYLADQEFWQPLRMDIIRCDDAFDLAMSYQYGTVKQAEDDLRALLAKFPTVASPSG